MKFEDFVNKWICNDKLSMACYQGSLHFQNIACIARFPAPVGEYVLATSLVEFSMPEFENFLGDLDLKLAIAFMELEG